MMTKSVCQNGLLLAGLSLITSAAAAVAPVRIVYKGHTVRTTAPVVQFRQGTLVPLRPVVQALGGHLVWEKQSQTAAVRYRGRRLQVDERAHELRLDGRPMSELLPPRRTQGQLLVPLKGVERFYGTRAQWQPRRRLLSFASIPTPRPVIGRAASGGAGPRAAAAPASVPDLRLRLTSDRSSYRTGQPVMLTLTVTNPASVPVTVEFPSAQHYDFEVRRDGQTVWRWSAGRMFTQALTQLTIGPGQQRVFTQTWNQKENNGQPVAAGSYEVRATLTTLPRPQPQAAPLTLRIGG